VRTSSSRLGAAPIVESDDEPRGTIDPEHAAHARAEGDAANRVGRRRIDDEELGVGPRDETFVGCPESAADRVVADREEWRDDGLRLFGLLLLLLRRRRCTSDGAAREQAEQHQAPRHRRILTR
jgi:hypothetical protein